MAIVKTTSQETGNSAPNGKQIEKPVNSTKTVVKPASRAAARTARPVVNRPGGVQTAPKPTGAFFSEMGVELRKVVWPTWDEVRDGTIVTVLLLLVFGAYIFGLDSMFAWFFARMGFYSQ